MTWDAPDILNWRRWDDTVTLSGQPNEAQLAHLAKRGVKHVINLGPYDNDGALEDEPGCLADLGVGYTYIPVDFSNPTDEDNAKFCAAFDAHKSAPLHVHCIYNARVTAFMMRYAQDGRGGDPDTMAAMMETIWRPGNVWSRFLGDNTRTDQPNTYAGYEY